MNPVSDSLGQFESGTHNQQPYFTLNSALSSPWDFLRPTKELHNAIADTAKTFLDSLAFSVSDTQSTRQHNRRKRKRFEEEQDAIPILRLKQLHVHGFTSDQIWEQATRIFDSTNQEIQRDYSWWAHNAEEGITTLQDDVTQASDHDILENFSDQSITDEEESELDDGLKMEELLQSDSGSEEKEDLSSDENFTSQSADQDDSKSETYVADRFGLNDGFFSIDDFNKQTELFERQDVRGGVDDDEDESDDEGVDWHTNPLALGKFQTTSGQLPPLADSGSMDDSEEEGGPTFGNMDFPDQSESDGGDVEPNMDGLGETNWINTSDIMYTDFFAPPPQKASAKKSRPLPKTQPQEAIAETDIDRAMVDVHRDLFEDEASAQDSGDDVAQSHDVQNQYSSHEKQRARIADEIRRLEAANVAKKEWMLSGEARAVERPINSLIEEDLDFERIGKPVPVVTTELSESIEELIKRRIIAKEFDEVIRRRPGLSDRQGSRTSRIELDDKKPQHSLADIYETDHLRAADPNHTDPQDQKLVEEHTDITNLWKEINAQLDTLSSWHYKPRTPLASINVVTDVATITMEDAQPTTSSAVRGSATLAPQEIYAPETAARGPGELVMSNGVPITKDEMSREDKAKLRRREKSRHKADIHEHGKQPRKMSEKQQMVTDLKKAGVKLIGKEGEVTDIHGNKITGTSAKNSAYTIKL